MKGKPQGGNCQRGGKEGLLFVNKKKQKNFYNLVRACFSVTGPVQTKVFAPLFSKSGFFLHFNRTTPVSAPAAPRSAPPSVPTGCDTRRCAPPAVKPGRLREVSGCFRRVEQPQQARAQFRRV